MEFIDALARYGIKYVVLLLVAIGGVMLGKKLRQLKNSK